jgi:hypothetical protein
MFSLKNLFRPKQTSVDFLLKNDRCKQLLDDFCKEHLENTTGLLIMWDEVNEEKQETYFDCTGNEPAEAILKLEQCKHRIQHEGLKDYD